MAVVFEGWKLPMKTFLQTILLVIVLSGFGYLVVKYRLQLGSFVNHCDAKTAILIIGLSGATILIDIVRVVLLFRILGFTQPLLKFFVVITATTAVSYSLGGKIGLPIRMHWQKKYCNIPYSVSAACMGIETVFGYLFMAATILVSLPFVKMQVPKTIVVTVLGIAVLFLIALSLMQLWPEHTERPKGFVARIRAEIRRVLARFPASILTQCGIALLFCFVLGSFVTAIRLHLQMKCLGLRSDTFTLYVIDLFSYFVSSFWILPGGLGAKEASLALLLRGISIPADAALVFAIADRIITTGLSICIGLCCLPFLNRKQTNGKTLS